MTHERGRPRNFDPDTALDRALEVFWRHGFQAASLTELTAVMGLSKPSLYAAFGDKEALYLKALERYVALQVAQHIAIFDTEPDARHALEKFLRTMAAMLTDPALPCGCLIVNGMADCGMPSTPPAIELALHKAVQGSEARLHRQFIRAQRDAQLAPDISAGDLAAFFTSLLAGLGILAKSGAKRAKLNAVINAAMRSWPESPVLKPKRRRPVKRWEN
ncbi:MAG: TetR family transcriptional [Gallionellaceae bacterium]|nr:MAG: TetR family transcriptional [Gallionellaceae bacterium]